MTLEGTLATLSPGYLAIDETQRVVGEWARDRFTSTTLEDIARREVISLVPLLRRRRVTPTGWPPSSSGETSPPASACCPTSATCSWSPGCSTERCWPFLGGVVGLLSVILLSIEGGPAFTGTTSLFHFFGYFGLFCATILILRVLVAVLQDGLN